MNRSFLLVGIIALVLAVAALVYFAGRQPSLVDDGADSEESSRTLSAPPVDGPPGISASLARNPAEDAPAEPQVSRSDSQACLSDSEAALNWLREEERKYVQGTYSQMFRHLGLNDAERIRMTDFLVEVGVRATRTCDLDPDPMDEQDRLRGIAAIVGDEGLHRFLAMEENVPSYGEVQYMQAIVEHYDVPMNDAQMDRMLEILIDAEARDLELPGADYEPNTIEWLEYRLAEIDERDRLIFEQASSVLSAVQVAHLYEQYQRESYRRAESLERQRRARADDSIPDLPLHYPARRTPDFLQ